MVFSFFFNSEDSALGRLEPEVLSWVTIVGGFTLLLGVVSIVRVNYSAVKRKKEGWGYKVATLISIFVMALPAMLSLEFLRGDQRQDHWVGELSTSALSTATAISALPSVTPSTQR